MKKFNTAPLSGMQELLPSLQCEFNRLKAGIAEAFAAHGFQNIETPIIERMEVLLAKAGGDTEKQIYKVVKTAETSKDADQALRFDHTVPLARYVVEHMNDLTFPFKVSQINRNFRGERTQKGRFREFYQCDVDVIGWQKLPLAYDVEIIRTLADALEVLPIDKFVIRVSNRKILAGLLHALDLNAKSAEIFSIVDHAEKVPETVTLQNLRDLQLNNAQVELVSSFTKINGTGADVVKQLRALNVDDGDFLAGVEELETVLTLLGEELSERVEVRADMLIVRGLDYYTGTVFETIAPDYREFGSLCSGGRYENLAQYYTEQALPGVGGSIGLTRLFAAMCDRGLIRTQQTQPIDICVIPFTINEYGLAEKVAQDLRQQGKKVDIVLTDKKFIDKIKYASKIATSMLVIGEDEAKTGNFTIKNLETGEQQAYKL